MKYVFLNSRYYAYKLPRASKSNKKSTGGTGSNYAFITSDARSTSWTLSEKLVNYNDSIMGRTLSPIYKDIDDLLVILYSDQPPKKDLDFERGKLENVINFFFMKNQRVSP